MWEADKIPLTLNEFALRELRFTLREAGLCTTLAQVRGVIHGRIEEFEKDWLRNFGIVEPQRERERETARKSKCGIKG